MYFKPEMITAIVEGRKTQTRRVCKPGEEISGERFDLHGIHILSVSNGRIKWELDRTYAVCPGRGKPGVWWKADGDWLVPDAFNEDRFYGPMIRDDHGRWFQRVEYRPLRIRITAIRRERVTDISEEDAWAEGCEAVSVLLDYINNPIELYVPSYAALWDRINTKPGTRWADAPDVWVLSFEVVK